MMQAHPSMMGEAQVVGPDSIPSEEHVGEPDVEVQPTDPTVTKHQVRITPLEKDPAASCLVELIDEDDLPLVIVPGKSLVDALLGIIRHMLPPEHPDAPSQATGTLDDED